LLAQRNPDDIAAATRVIVTFITAHPRGEHVYPLFKPALRLLAGSYAKLSTMDLRSQAATHHPTAHRRFVLIESERATETEMSMAAQKR